MKVRHDQSHEEYDAPTTRAPFLAFAVGAPPRSDASEASFFKRDWLVAGRMPAPPLIFAFTALSSTSIASWSAPCPIVASNTSRSASPSARPVPRPIFVPPLIFLNSLDAAALGLTTTS
jgi:hypothetical protein